MHLVAHAEPARDDRFERNAARCAQRLAEQRAEHVAQPGETIEHLGVVAAEAHDLAEAFVDRAIGAIAELAVLDDHHRHRARGHAGHRTDRAEMMVGLELDAAARRERRRLFEIFRPALEHDRAADRALHRAAHALPFDRRPGMQHQPLFQLRNDGFRRHDIDENRIAFQHAANRFAIGRIDAIGFFARQIQPRDDIGELRITARRRRPAYLRDRNAETFERMRETLQADIDTESLDFRRLGAAAIFMRRSYRSKLIFAFVRNYLLVCQPS